jgi:hypothetical protein
MTKTDGHRHYDQKIGHKQFGQATSDPTWPILHGMIATIPNGRNSNLAQSICVALHGPSPITRPFNSGHQPVCGQLFFLQEPFAFLYLLGLGLFVVHLRWPFCSHFIYWALAFYILFFGPENILSVPLVMLLILDLTVYKQIFEQKAKNLKILRNSQ